MTGDPNNDRPRFELWVFVAALFLVWTIRAAWFSKIDESISSPTLRELCSNSLKLCFWVVPAVGFARWFRDEPPSHGLSLEVEPNRGRWTVDLLIVGSFLASILALELGLGGKALSSARFESLPLLLVPLRYLLSPFLEEAVFRGFLMKELLRCFPPAVSIGINSVLFVGIHLPFWLIHDGLTGKIAGDLAGVFVFSVFAGWMYVRTKSVWLPTIAHVGNNLMASFLVMAR